MIAPGIRKVPVDICKILTDEAALYNTWNHMGIVLSLPFHLVESCTYLVFKRKMQMFVKCVFIIVMCSIHARAAFLFVCYYMYNLLLRKFQGITFMLEHSSAAS